MSHIVSIKTQVKDAHAVRAACRRLQLAAPEEGTFELFSGKVSGLAVHLPDWRHPVVCNLASGELKYDNFEGRWGDPARLDQLLQIYAVEKAKIEARRQGHTCSEQTLADGSIKLTISVGGAA